MDRDLNHISSTVTAQFIPRVQDSLSTLSLDAWLIYDCERMNPIARSLTGDAGRFLSRPWVYFIPRSGEPQYVCHAIDASARVVLPGSTILYQGKKQFVNTLSSLLDGLRNVAMEYSPLAAIPTMSRVDAGTIELIRSFGVEVQSSAALLQHATCRLDAAQLASHRRATEILDNLRISVVSSIFEDLERGYHPTEYQIQGRFLSGFEAHNLTTNFPPIIACGANAGNAHYQPEKDHCRAITPDNLVLLDFWARENSPQGIYADMTWMIFTGERIPSEYEHLFNIVTSARDAVLKLLRQRHEQKKPVHGYEADDAARELITAHGYGDFFCHRTGHNMGHEVHGPGANLDNLESHDDRLLIQGTLFTVEPGIYTPQFGFRSEIDVYHSADNGFEVTTPVQRRLITPSHRE